MNETYRGILIVAGLLALFYGAIQVGWPFVLIVLGALAITAGTAAK